MINPQRPQLHIHLRFNHLIASTPPRPQELGQCVIQYSQIASVMGRPSKTLYVCEGHIASVQKYTFDFIPFSYLEHNGSRWTLHLNEFSWSMVTLQVNRINCGMDFHVGERFKRYPTGDTTCIVLWGSIINWYIVVRGPEPLNTSDRVALSVTSPRWLCRR